MLPSSALLLSSSFLSGCNKDVLFNLRVSSLTEPGLYKEVVLDETNKTYTLFVCILLVKYFVRALLAKLNRLNGLLLFLFIVA